MGRSLFDDAEEDEQRHERESAGDHHRDDPAGRLARARAAAVLVQPRVCSELHVPWCRCIPSATIARR